MKENVSTKKKYSSSIINSKESNVAKGNSVNEKLKQYAKLDMQQKLLNNNDNDYEDIERNTYKGIEKTVVYGIKCVKSIFSSKVGLIVAGIILVCILIINLFSGSISIVTAIGEVGSPNIDDDTLTTIKTMMEELDENCGKNLNSGFTLQGHANINWKTALSLLLGYYKNNLSEFNKSVNSSGIEGIIDEASSRYNIDKWLICGIIEAESSWRNLPANAYSCMGYMQVGTSVTDELGYDYSKMNNAYDNIIAGTHYYKYVLDMFNGNETLGLAGYNAGPNAVIRYGGVPPYSETRQYIVRVRNFTEQFRTGSRTIPDINVEYVSNNASNGELTNIYNLINEVSSDHNTLTRNDFNTVLERLQYDNEQKAIAMALFECDMWESIFGEGFDFNFNINGSYNSNAIDGSNLTGSRRRIIELAQSLAGKAYLWGGRCYDYNCSPDQVSRMDCSGFTGYLMAKIFGATYYNGPSTYIQRDSYCYQIPESEALPGDIVFNSSCSHTLIYAGDREGVHYYWHSPQTGDVIKCSQYNRPVTFWRLKGVNYEN